MEVADWARDGWVVARGVLDDRTVGALLGHLDELLAASPHAQASGLLAGPVVDDPVWLAAVSDERLLDVAEALLGPEIALFSSCWVVKPPGAGRPASWHQDGGDWPLEPLDAATLSVALDDAGPSNGGLRVIPGSHRDGLLPHHRDDSRLESELFPVWIDVLDAAGAVDVRLRAGDVSAHHPLLVHGSGPNHSQRPRRALVIRYRAGHAKLTSPHLPSPLLRTRTKEI